MTTEGLDFSTGHGTGADDEPDPEPDPGPEFDPGRYVFAVTFTLEPPRDVTIDPDRFETIVFRPANPPPETGWLFFRDNLWRGDLSDPEYFRRLTTDLLDVPVLSVSYRRFEVSRPALAHLEAAIEANLEDFRADSVTEVVSKYFGSSIEIIG